MVGGVRARGGRVKATQGEYADPASIVAPLTLRGGPRQDIEVMHQIRDFGNRERAKAIDECSQVACAAISKELGGLAVSHSWFSLKPVQEAVIAALAELKEAPEVSE